MFRPLAPNAEMKGKTAMAQNYYQKEIETMSREEMRKLQSEKLVRQVKHVYENVPYYRNLMDEKGVTPDDVKSIDDLSSLRRAGNWASRPGHRALARSSLLRDWLCSP